MVGKTESDFQGFPRSGKQAKRNRGKTPQEEKPSRCTCDFCFLFVSLLFFAASFVFWFFFTDSDCESGSVRISFY